MFCKIALFWKEEGCTLTIWIKGSFDVYGSAGFRRRTFCHPGLGNVTALESLSLACETLICDLRGVEYLDATGLAVFLGLEKRRREKGKSPLRLVVEKPIILRIFEITGLNKILTIVNSQDPFLMQGDHRIELEEVEIERPPLEGGMSVADAGRKGGQVTAARYGKEWLIKIGKKGGEVTKKRHGSDFYSYISGLRKKKHE